MPQAPLPTQRDLWHLKAAARHCTACDLYLKGTQTVFGEGPPHARVMLVGEQPGDQEDRSGHPFVGPAGRLLDTALERAHLDRSSCYVTNAVKHFKWTQRGKRRLHSRPNAQEVRACRPWLLAELAAVRPEVLVCMGATAAQSLLGPGFRVTHHRGELLPSTLAPHVLATVHPSAILRAPDEAERRLAFDSFVDDLSRVARVLSLEPRAGPPP